MPHKQQEMQFNPLKATHTRNTLKDVTTLPFRGIATLYDVKGRTTAIVNLGIDAKKKGVSVGIKF